MLSIRRLVKIFNSNSFVKNVLTLMTGTTLAQAIPILVSPILSRIYTPEEFGVFGLYTSLISIFSVIATGKYELAVILPKEDDDSINIIALTVCISLIVNVSLFILSIVFGDDFVVLLKNKGFTPYLFFVPLSVFLMSIYQSLTFWNNRKKEYKRISLSRVIQSSSAAAFNIGMGSINNIRGGLIHGTVIGQALSTLILSSSFFNQDRVMLGKIKISKMKEMSKRYINFPRTTMFSSFVNAFFNNGRYLILGLMLETDILGQLLLSFRVLAIPTTVISDAFGDILFQKMSVWNNSALEKKEMFGKLKKILGVLILIAFFPALILFLWGEYIISFVFGSQWTIAGKFTSFLSISLFFQFIASPFCRFFFVVEKHLLYLIWETLRLALVFIPIFFIGHINTNYNLIVIAMSISISLSYLLLLLFLRRIFQ